MFTKRNFIKTVASAMTLAMVTPALAQDAFPSKPIRLIVPYSPGGGTDVTARIVADAMADHLSQPIVVENRPGASGTVGTILAKQSAADGYTLLFGIQASLALNPSLFKAADYNAKNDFVGISLLTESPYVITVPGDSDISDFASFKTAATEGMTMANGGSAALLAARLLARQADLNLTNIPYAGSGDAISDILAGRVNSMISSPVSVLPHIESGALRPILVTSEERYPALPETPTAQEVGFDGFAVSGWYSIVAPAGLSEDRLALLNEAFNAALADETTQNRLIDAGVLPSARALDAAATTAFIAGEIDRWSAEIADAGIEAK